MRLIKLTRYVAGDPYSILVNVDRIDIIHSVDPGNNGCCVVVNGDYISVLETMDEVYAIISPSAFIDL